jgi:predicted amidohydrolase
VRADRREGTAVRIALGQLEAGTDIQANLTPIDRFASEAALDGATLVAFPEYATCEKKKVDATFLEVAEPLDGLVCRELASTACRHRIALVADVVETSDELGKAYNTLVAFGPDGGRLAFYRKIHLFDAQGFGESTFIKPGPSTTPVVFEYGGARFGLMTCGSRSWPGHWPTPAPRYCWFARPGCRATHKTEQWLALNVARAIENSEYVPGTPSPWPAASLWIRWVVKLILALSLGCGRWTPRLRR